MHTGNYAGGPRIIPEEKHQAFPRARKRRFPGVKGRIRRGTTRPIFCGPCKDGQAAGLDFQLSGPLSEMVLWAAWRSGRAWANPSSGTARNLRATNLPELDPLIHREYRKGWSLE